MTVPTHSIKRDENNKYDYVTVISGSEYIKVPITISLSSDSISIVKSMSKEKRTELGISSNVELKVYDQIVLED